MSQEQFIDADAFIASARSMLGVKWRHQGRNPLHGVDCAGLAVCAAAKCGYQAIDFTNYERQPAHSDFILTLEKNCARIPIGEEQAGDLLVFEFDNNPQHLAILTQPGRIIHAYGHLSVRKVVEHDIADYWNTKMRAVFRVKREI